MKITALELTVLEHLVVVTLKTDEGLEGYGFTQKGRSIAEALAEVVRPQVLGEDPLTMSASGTRCWTETAGAVCSPLMPTAAWMWPCGI